MIKLPRLLGGVPVTERDLPTLKFSRDWNSAIDSIETTLNAILQIPAIQAALADLDTATQAAQAAADAAQSAATDAQLAADAAQAQADAAAAAQAASAREAALTSSYIEPASVLNASPTTITIDAHTRFYGDGTSAAVAGGAIAATAPADVDYVFYDDPARTGGAVTYQVSATAPIQTGDTHVVGAVTIPLVGSQAGGAGPRPPGFVTPEP